jgi:ABC-type proline/glycine betaine transport system permease subunit
VMVTVGDMAKTCEHLRLTVACLVIATAVGIALTIG